MNKNRTIKIRLEDYHRLKVIAAQRGETMLDLLSRLIKQAAETDESSSEKAPSQKE